MTWQCENECLEMKKRGFRYFHHDSHIFILSTNPLTDFIKRISKFFRLLKKTGVWTWSFLLNSSNRHFWTHKIFELALARKSYCTIFCIHPPDSSFHPSTFILPFRENNQNAMTSSLRNFQQWWSTRVPLLGYSYLQPLIAYSVSRPTRTRKSMYSVLGQKKRRVHEYVWLSLEAANKMNLW